MPITLNGTTGITTPADTVTGNATVGGTLGVTGNTTLGSYSETVVAIGTVEEQMVHADQGTNQGEYLLQQALHELQLR